MVCLGFSNILSARKVLANRQLRTGEPINEKQLVSTVAAIVAEILQACARDVLVVPKLSCTACCVVCGVRCAVCGVIWCGV